MKIELSTLKKILQTLTITEVEELTCGECFHEIDHYVDMLRSGKSPSDLMPLVKHHITLCPPCREEFEALLVALEAIDADLE